MDPPVRHGPEPLGSGRRLDANGWVTRRRGSATAQHPGLPGRLAFCRRADAAGPILGRPWSPRKEHQMLVLTRRSQQSIMIGKDVVITVLEVRGDQVRIGVSAPREVEVHREEVFLELEQANKAAASPDPTALKALGRLLPSGPEAPPAPATDPAPSSDADQAPDR